MSPALVGGFLTIGPPDFLFDKLDSEDGLCQLNGIVVLSTAMFFKISFSRVFLFPLILLVIRYFVKVKNKIVNF